MERDIQSIDDVLANPSLLYGRSLQEVRSILGRIPHWRTETLGKGSRKGEGWVLREYNKSGRPTGRMIRWHPGGGHHGSNPYWRVHDFQSKSPLIPAGRAKE